MSSIGIPIYIRIIIIGLLAALIQADTKLVFGRLSPRLGRQFSTAQASSQSLGGLGGGFSSSSAQSSSVNPGPVLYGLGGGYNQYGGQMGGYGGYGGYGGGMGGYGGQMQMQGQLGGYGYGK